MAAWVPNCEILDFLLFVYFFVYIFNCLFTLSAVCLHFYFVCLLFCLHCQLFIYIFHLFFTFSAVCSQFSTVCLHFFSCLTARFRFSKKSPKLTIFGIFNELLATQNVMNFAMFNETFSVIFKHSVFLPPCYAR